MHSLFHACTGSASGRAVHLRTLERFNYCWGIEPLSSGTCQVWIQDIVLYIVLNFRILSEHASIAAITCVRVARRHFRFPDWMKPLCIWRRSVCIYNGLLKNKIPDICKTAYRPIHLNMCIPTKIGNLYIFIYSLECFEHEYSWKKE